MFHRVLRLHSSSSSRAAALCVAAAAPFAYHVREYPVTETTATDATAPIAANERARKQWELIDGVYAINTVKIDLPGLVFVAHDPSTSASLATVQVSGDSRAIVECVEVVQLPPNGVKLRFKSKECAELRGHLLTTVSLPTSQQVNLLQTSGGGTTVVGEEVLVTDCKHASVDVSLQGSGQLHVAAKEKEINLSRLRLAVQGRGTLQFIGPDQVTVRDQLLLEVAGAGSLLADVGNVEASLLKSTLAGSGTVHVGIRDSLQVDMLKTTIADTGNGRVQFDGEGHCRIQRCSVVGSGKLDARGIQSEIATTSVAVGHADVTMQVADKMTASGWGSTTLRYVGEPPRAIDGKSVALRPAQAASTDHKGVNVEPVPNPEDAFTRIQAVYEPRVITSEKSSGVGNAARFLADTFFGEEVRRSNQKEVKINEAR